MGNRHPSIAPYDTFETADGAFVLSVGNDDQFARLARVIARQDLALDPRFTTNPDRVRHYDELRRELTLAFSSWKRATILAALNEAGVPASAVRTVTEALADSQIAAREMIVPLDHVAAGRIRVLGSPLKLSATAATVRLPPPMLGQHTSAVLRELGFDGVSVR
jgi:crotonobetainyl-CoA:carnitine CoA-transferase CaiB-like acyl-CoA transferase